MICTVCGKETSAYKVVQDKQGTCCICLSCYGKQESSTPFPITTFFDPVEDLVPRTQNKVCDQCGSTFEDYKRTGLVGCGHCYEVFREELLPVIEHMQGATRYMGQHLNMELSKIERQKEELQERIRECVQEENYEEASRLKKELDRLKEER